jgi:DNA invertase Pin-like site-specific DNA recombinase
VSGGASTAAYLRVSTLAQSLESQQGDIERWCAVNAPNATFFTDKASGKNMQRPSFDRMMKLVYSGHIDRIVIWRLDRLGRTASGLTNLFEVLVKHKVNLVSLKDGLDLETPAGRLMANVLASVAAFELELRGERVNAGLNAAYLRGYAPKGGKPGRVCDPTSRSRRQQAVILAQAALAAGQRPSAIKIGEVLGVSRIAVYDFWKKEGFTLPPLERGTAREAEGEGAN